MASTRAARSSALSAAFPVAFALAFAWAALGPPPSAFAETVHFHQRGYVAGGKASTTTLTDAAVAAFVRRNPDIDVRVVGVPWTREGDLKLRSALLSRERIDVFRVTNDQLPDFVPSRGTLVSPVDPLLTPADLEDISPGALDAVTVGGRRMAWPLWSTAVALVANEAILRERGVEPPEGRPWTWDEFLAALERVAFRRDDGTRVDAFTVAARPPLFEWSPLLWAHCGPAFLPDDSAAGEGLKLAPDLPAALARVAELRTRGLVPASFGVDDQTAVQGQFLEGRAAILMTTPAFVRTLASRGDLPFRILPPPTGDAGRAITTGALGCFAVVDHPRAPERTAAAHRLARYLTSAEVAEDVPGWYLAPPVRASVKGFFDDPNYAPLAPIVRSAVYMNPPGGAGFLEQTIVPRFQAAIMGAISPERAVEEIREAWGRIALE